MKRYVLIFSALASLGSNSFADTVEAGDDSEDQDIRALREWIDTKRQISLKEIGGDLSLSGEVRTEFQNTHETKNGKSVRTSSIDTPSRRGFDIEFNFMLDYRADQTWASVKLEFDNDMGIVDGTLNKLALERAYWGVRAIEGDTYTFDIEAGRRYMSSVFDSQVQYKSFFDGIILRYDVAFEKIGDFYFHLGPFVINENRDHYGIIGEFGFLNICGTGFYTKFSITNWYPRRRYPKSFETDRFRFVNTQVIGGYRFRMVSIEKMGLAYSGLLFNWAAKKLEVSDFKRASYAFYLGFSIGQLLKQWDWAFDINYQIVAAQAVPDFDVSGIGLGNGDGSGFYTEKIKFPTKGNPPKPTTLATAGGQTNYHGYRIRFDVLLTAKLDLQQAWEQSWTWDRAIGPRRTYNRYELELIYSW